MMRLTIPRANWVLAALFSIAAVTCARADDATKSPNGLYSWPQVGPYLTTLVKLPNGNPMCITGLVMQPIDDVSKFGFQIMVQPKSTHFYFIYNGENVNRPESIQLYDNGEPFAWMSVIDYKSDGPHWLHIMADMPGDMFVKEFLPHFLHGNNLVLAVGSGRYSIPNSKPKDVMNYMFQCGFRAQREMGGLPEKPR